MRTHGESNGKNRTKEYMAWRGVITRCTNTTNKRYPEWGGRGITVCDRWREYENFLDDMGRAPSRKHSIDRTDNNKGYYKENCRWATRQEQSNNTRRAVKIRYNGEEKSLRDWCTLMHLNYQQMNARIWGGWTPERAFNTPMTKRGDINPTSLFKREEVLIIKEAIQMGFSLKGIASYFKTNRGNISRIKLGRTYSSI